VTPFEVEHGATNTIAFDSNEVVARPLATLKTLPPGAFRGAPGPASISLGWTLPPGGVTNQVTVVSGGETVI